LGSGFFFSFGLSAPSKPSSRKRSAKLFGFCSSTGSGSLIVIAIQATFPFWELCLKQYILSLKKGGLAKLFYQFKRVEMMEVAR